MGYVFGVDGGASKTHALVVSRSGRVAGFGQAGSGNHQSQGLEPAVKEIERAVRMALSMAGLPTSAAELGCFCLAGADLPEDYALLQAAMDRLGLARKVIVKNDTLAALRAGITRSWGVVVICGTGFNAAGRAPDGREIIFPGLGPISGDWGGGSALSEEMIRLVMRAWDGRGQPTLLTEMILEALGTPSVEALLERLYHDEIPRRRLLDLAPLLFEAAEAGDPPSQALVVRMGEEVAVTARALIRRLALQQEDVEVILGGSVFKGVGNLLTDTIARSVQTEAPRARIVRLRHEPVVGAALLALESAGIDGDGDLYRELVNSLPDRLRTAASETSAVTD